MNGKEIVRVGYYLKHGFGDDVVNTLVVLCLCFQWHAVTEVVGMVSFQYALRFAVWYFPFLNQYAAELHGINRARFGVYYLKHSAYFVFKVWNKVAVSVVGLDAKLAIGVALAVFAPQEPDESVLNGCLTRAVASADGSRVLAELYRYVA